VVYPGVEREEKKGVEKGSSPKIRPVLDLAKTID
jgi:hypothetical protein